MFVKVLVKTGARRDALSRTSDGRYQISVKAKPENNSANQRVIELLAAALAVPAKRIRFVSGQRSPSKMFEVR